MKNIKQIEISPQELERLWQWLLNEANLYTNRVNFYIVAQSMFFVAFASSSRISKTFLVVCSLSGIFLSVTWLLMSKHQNDNIIKPLREVVYKNWDIGKTITKGQKKRLRTHFILGIVLPLFMIIMWLSVLIAELFNS